MNSGSLIRAMFHPQVNELRCVEQKLTRQNEMIRNPIAELGCEQAPPGCEVVNADESGIASSGSGSTNGNFCRRMIISYSCELGQGYITPE